MLSVGKQHVINRQLILYWKEFSLLVSTGIVGPGPGSYQLRWQACRGTGDPSSRGCCGARLGGTLLSASSVSLAVGSHPQPPTPTDIWMGALERRLESS